MGLCDDDHEQLELERSDDNEQLELEHHNHNDNGLDHDHCHQPKWGYDDRHDALMVHDNRSQRPTEANLPTSGYSLPLANHGKPLGPWASME